MQKKQAIHITIPHPCSQDLDEMAMTGQGRFCTHCNKNVIDFSTWSDTALYGFFAKNKEHVCGRFLETQLQRPIHIPYQPHSNLYRIAVALGLTLIFTQTPSALAQNRSPKTENSSILKQPEPVEQFGEIRGSVLNDKQVPMMNVVVNIYSGGILKGSSITDSGGNYMIKSLDFGYYDLQVLHNRYKELIVWGVVAPPGEPTLLNITLRQKQVNDTDVIVENYRKLLNPGDRSDAIKNANDIRTIWTGEVRTVRFSDPIFDIETPTKRTFTR